MHRKRLQVFDISLNQSHLFCQLTLAFVVDHTQQRCWAFCRAVWTKLGSQRLVWERLRALFSAYRLEAMREVLDALLDGFEKSHPLLITDTS